MPSAQTQISLIELKAKRIWSLFQASFKFWSINFRIFNFLYNRSKNYVRIVGLLKLSYIFGLPKFTKDKVEKFSFPKFNIFIFGIMLMFFYASIGIIIDWSALWLTKDYGSFIPRWTS